MGEGKSRQACVSYRFVQISLRLASSFHLPDHTGFPWVIETTSGRHVFRREMSIDVEQ